MRKDSEKVVDLSGMGCERGLQVCLMKHDEQDEVLNMVEERVKDVLNGSEVGGCNEVECGWGGRE